ncbi:MAG: nickel-dependent lactate racemase [Candidatus Thermoplasmatota archaeon]
MRIQIPYGKNFIPLDIHKDRLLDVINPSEICQSEKPESLISHALDNPLGTDRISDLVEPGDKVAILVDDYTRPCPTQVMLPRVLDELHDAGVDYSDINIIIANGTHKPPIHDQIVSILGERISRSYQVTSNDCLAGDHVYVGTSRQGNRIEVLRGYAEADFKIILGDIEYHYFAGYGGTRKSILPGISSYSCIQRNHKLLFDKNARTGVLRNNPINNEMNEAMHLAGVDFAFNVVLNSHKQIVGAWAGKPEIVMDAGVKLVDAMYKKEVDAPSDIVIVSAGGYPHDIDLYQSFKGLHSVLPVTNKNSVIILIAECINGAGNTIYVEWLRKHRSSHDIKRSLQEEFVMGAHKAYYHLEAVENYSVILISSIDSKEIKELYRFKPASSIEEALKEAYSIVDENTPIRIVPYGSTTLLSLKN